MHTLNEIMDIAPAIDDTSGATPADIVTGKTSWGLTSGGWGLITGTMPSAPVPKTGQTTSSATGDDGDLRRGVAWPDPRFTDNGDGTVTDNLTGLIWLQNVDCFGAKEWAVALSDANSLAPGSCGLLDDSSAGDWRLPNLRELQSVLDYGRYSFALPSGHPFTNITSGSYWTSTSVSYDTSLAWYVALDWGSVDSIEKVGYLRRVWPVRGGQ
jgi:hypothetical protein